MGRSWHGRPGILGTYAQADRTRSDATLFQSSTDVCIVVASSEVRADAKQAIGLHDAADELEQAGLRILEAANANESLAMLEVRSDDVQVIFTALDIPGSMNGLALAERVYQCGCTPHGQDEWGLSAIRRAGAQTGRGACGTDPEPSFRGLPMP